MSLQKLQDAARKSQPCCALASFALLMGWALLKKTVRALVAVFDVLCSRNHHPLAFCPCVGSNQRLDQRKPSSTRTSAASIVQKWGQQSPTIRINSRHLRKSQSSEAPLQRIAWWDGAHLRRITWWDRAHLGHLANAENSTGGQQQGSQREFEDSALSVDCGLTVAVAALVLTQILRDCDTKVQPNGRSQRHSLFPT